MPNFHRRLVYSICSVFFVVALVSLFNNCGEFEASTQVSKSMLGENPSPDDGGPSPSPAPLPSGRARLANGRFSLGGKPSFLLGVYDSGGSYSMDENFWTNALANRQLTDIPINVYLNYWLGEMPIGPTNALMNVLQRRGAMFIQTANCFRDQAGWLANPKFSLSDPNYVRAFAQHPAAFGYYIMDECREKYLQETIAHHQSLKSLDPQGITFAVPEGFVGEPFAPWVPAADLLGPDPYPLYLPGGMTTENADLYPHVRVPETVAKMRMTVPADRPIIAILQFFKFCGACRLPTFNELRNHAIMAIVEGAQGIMWWDIGVNGLLKAETRSRQTEYMGYLKSMVVNFKALEPVLLAPSTSNALVGNSTRASDPVVGRIAQLESSARINTPYNYFEGQAYTRLVAQLKSGDRTGIWMLDDVATIRTRTKVVNGVGYVFAYNYSNKSTAVKFTWGSSPGLVREWSLTGSGSGPSGQNYPLTGNSWSDTFGPYDSRIYVIGRAP
jgi:hypothetical protein